MRNPTPRGWRVIAFLMVAFGLWIAGAAPAYAGDADDGPVFFIVSTEGALTPPTLEVCDYCYGEGEGCYYCDESGYDIIDYGPPTTLAKIGTCIAGPDIGSARYISEEVVTIPVPLGENEDPEFSGTGATIIGSFRETDASEEEDPEIHMVTPVPPGPGTGEIAIPGAAQAAFFNASFALATALVEGDEALGNFPTTGDLAMFIYNNQDDAGADLQDIVNAMFTTGSNLQDLNASLVEAEGDLFPHNPDGELFNFEFSFDPEEEENNFTSSVCTPVGVDIKPGNSKNVVNYKSKGVVWVAILGTGTFDPTDEVDTTTVSLGAASVKDSKDKDVNNDGYDDLVLKFDVEKIGLTKTTTSVDLEGELYSGACIEGSDSVTTVPNGKK